MLQNGDEIMRFKVGDKVKVRDDLIVGKTYNNNTFVKDMEKHLGKIVTIESIHRNTYSIVENNWYWTDAMFENDTYNITGVSPDNIIRRTHITLDKNGISLSCEMKKENNMNDTNKIVDLYYERQINLIYKKYKNIIQTEFNNIDVVRRYNDIENKFLSEIGELENEYQMYINSKHVVIHDVLNVPDIMGSIRNKYEEDKNNEIQLIDEKVEEVRALLAISNDLDYQLKVLKKYKIIDSKLEFLGNE